MQIELTKQEIELIDSALSELEKEISNSITFGAVICQKVASLVGEEIADGAYKKVSAEHARRKGVAILLRAKLYQALTRDTEHSVEPPPPA